MPDPIPSNDPQGGQTSALPKKKWAYVPIRRGNRFVIRHMRVNVDWKPRNMIVVHHDDHEPAASPAPAADAPPIDAMIKSFRLVDGFGRPVEFMLKASPRHTRWDPIGADPFGGYVATAGTYSTFFWPDPIKAREAAAFYGAKAEAMERQNSQDLAAGAPRNYASTMDARQMADAARECVAVHGLIAGSAVINGEPMAKAADVPMRMAAPDEVIWEASVDGVPVRLARWRSTLVGTIRLPGRLPFHMILHPDHDAAKKQIRAAVADLKAGRTPNEGVFRREEIAA